jgi:hypothetical protein
MIFFLSLLEVWHKIHRFQSTGFTDLLIEYLDVDGAIESEHVTPCSCFVVNKCGICQENKTDALEHKKQKGIQALKERASQRQKIRDVR